MKSMKKKEKEELGTWYDLILSGPMNRMMQLLASTKRRPDKFISNNWQIISLSVQCNLLALNYFHCSV